MPSPGNIFTFYSNLSRQQDLRWNGIRQAVGRAIALYYCIFILALEPLTGISLFSRFAVAACHIRGRMPQLRRAAAATLPRTLLLPTPPHHPLPPTHSCATATLLWHSFYLGATERGDCFPVWGGRAEP